MPRRQAYLVFITIAAERYGVSALPSRFEQGQGQSTRTARSQDRQRLQSISGIIRGRRLENLCRCFKGRVHVSVA